MKILTFSFDDCEIYDRQLCDLLRLYGIRATFYLMSGRLGEKVPFRRYGEDTVVERVTAEELPETYRGMEVASHTRYHNLTDAADIEQSIRELSHACGYPVVGFAYPGGGYTMQQVEMLQNDTPVCYARSAFPTHSFQIPKNWYTWQPTSHYADDNVGELADRFINAPASENMLFHIFGHSYELTNPNGKGKWEDLEKLVAKLANREDILYCTNGEAWWYYQGSKRI